MSITNSILIKDPNLIFNENFVEKRNIKTKDVSNIVIFEK